MVKIDCEGLEPSDYKKIGAKLKVLIPQLLCFHVITDDGNISCIYFIIP